MNFLNILLLFVPAAIAAEFMHASPVVIFALSALGIVPLSVLGGAVQVQDALSIRFTLRARRVQ